MTADIGTVSYMAPEIYDHLNYNEKVDVYSFGVLFFFVLNNCDISRIKIGDILRGKKIEIPENFTDLAKKIIYSCLLFDANDRPSFEEILQELENG